MTTISARSRAIERIASICRTATADDRSLRLALLDEIRRAVGFDAFAWLLTDPETEVGSAPLADVARILAQRSRDATARPPRHGV